MGSNLTPAEKIDIIYALAIATEKRRRMQVRLQLFKWVVIVVVIGSIVLYPGFIMWKITDIMKPIIISTASGIIQTQKAELKNSFKDLLPSGFDVQ